MVAVGARTQDIRFRDFSVMMVIRKLEGGGGRRNKVHVGDEIT